MWVNILPNFVNVLEKPVTELRNPIRDARDLEWTTKAFLSHFALGFQLGLLLLSCILLISWYRGTLGVSGISLPPAADHKKLSRFARVRNWLEWFCLGASLPGDRFYFVLRASFWSAIVANAIDIDHALMLYGGPDRVLHWFAFTVSVVVVLFCGRRILQAKDEYSVRRYAFWFCLAFSIIVHVVEDYTLGWF